MVVEISQSDELEIPERYIQRWQTILDTLSKIIDVPAALIMKFNDPYLEVFVSSKEDETNPYHVGDREIKTGLYCETVVEDQVKLDIPNALKDEDWNNNPDIKLGMINYLGLPINWPDKTPFGTICILDREERDYPENVHKLLDEFAKVIENYLELIYDEAVIKKQMDRIQKLEEILRVCSYCKKVRSSRDSDEWLDIEDYMNKYYDQESTHGICEDCLASRKYDQ